MNVTAAFEERYAAEPVEAGGEPDRRSPAVIEIGGNRLSDSPPLGGDLVQIQVLQTVGH